jgi:hypothetical protein
MPLKLNNINKDKLYKIYGSVLVLISLILAFLEYEKLFLRPINFEFKERYMDYSILLYISSWIIYVLIFLAGILTLFKSKKAPLFLLILSFSSLLEVYANEAIYFVKSIDDTAKYILFFTSLISIISFGLKYFQRKKTYLIEFVLSITLAIMIVYLPNALISFYF